MKFIVNRNLLLQALQHTRCYMKPGIFIFANYFKMVIVDNTLLISGTDCSMFITESIKLETPPIENQERPFYVHATRIMKAIKALDQQPLEFEVGEYQLTVHHAEGYFQLPISDCTLPEPKTITMEEAITLHMEAPGLHSQLSKVAFATADDELRPVMTGISIEIERDQIIYVASDGHILVRLIKPHQAYDGPTGQFIMPRPVANTLIKILPKTGYCDLYFQGKLGKIIIDNNITLQFEFIDGRFPNYRSVMPENFDTCFNVDRKQILKCLSRLSIFSSDRHTVKIKLESPDQLAFVSRDIDEQVLSSEHITCQTVRQCESFRRGLLLNIRLLTQLIKSITSDRIVFNVQDSDHAFTLTPLPESDIEHVTCLLMPILQGDDE